MSKHSDLIDRYFAIWNETDAGKRRELIARTWTGEGVYRDPQFKGDGPDGIDAMIASVQQLFPGHEVCLAGKIDANNSYLRFDWQVRANGGPAVVSGIDIAVVSADDRLQSVTGFFGGPPTR